MNDLISRQAAIEAIASDIKYLEGEINKRESDPSKYTDNFKLLMTSRIDGLLDAQLNIESLPSADRPTDEEDQLKIYYVEQLEKKLERQTEILKRAVSKVKELSEPKTGKWKNSDFIPGMISCDQCGMQRNPKFKIGLGTWNFCPNCGARMEGGK